jgi:type I restriction enzyme S subunit
MTEIDSWQKKEVRHVGEVVTGTTPSTKKPEYYGDEFKLISPADLDNGKYVTTAHRMLSSLGLEQCRILPKDTVLVGCIGNVGKIGMVADEKAATNQQINSVICNQDHDPNFVYYSLCYNRERLEKVAVKTTVPILNKSNFERFNLDIPRFPEQRYIAHILSTVQTAIEQQTRLITLTQELKQALMHKLFTEGLRGEKQKMTEIGPVPESWEVVELGSLVGETEQVKLQTEGNRQIKYIDVSGISREYLRVETTTDYLLKDAPGRARKKVNTGDVIFATVRPTLLRVAFVNEELNNQVCSTAFCVLRAKKDVSNKYIYYVVQHEQFIKQLAAIESGASYPAVTDKLVKKRKVPKPKHDEQIQIAEIFDVIDKKIFQDAHKKIKLEELFRTLLNQLMTGQIRVNNIDLPGLT